MLATNPNICAREILETVPSVMRMIRTEMRSCRAPDLSVPQFRSLAFINRNPGTSLSDVAEHVGLTPPSTSKLIDGLVKRRLVERELSASDRRKITLVLTGEGKACLASAMDCAQQYISAALSELSVENLTTIIEAMQLLDRTFSPRGIEESTTEP
jgi:DNA-binding MarR family transcriptional regulator